MAVPVQPSPLPQKLQLPYRLQAPRIHRMQRGPQASQAPRVPWTTQQPQELRAPRVLQRPREPRRPQRPRGQQVARLMSPQRRSRVVGEHGGERPSGGAPRIPQQFEAKASHPEFQASCSLRRDSLQSIPSPAGTDHHRKLRLLRVASGRREPDLQDCQRARLEQDTFCQMRAQRSKASSSDAGAQKTQQSPAGRQASPARVFVQPLAVVLRLRALGTRPTASGTQHLG